MFRNFERRNRLVFYELKTKLFKAPEFLLNSFQSLSNLLFAIDLCAHARLAYCCMNSHDSGYRIALYVACDTVPRHLPSDLTASWNSDYTFTLHNEPFILSTITPS